ncbi:DDT domain-containing protein PTM-like [Senna tora]|uniref:DDT domain-containing protein PTM-like n=1 Tax=Senna tora TaxID=362788 RepID=A0A834WQC3_9FABA|nr:DDT domain-containing protein PTM-like [Senna tora]
MAIAKRPIFSEWKAMKAPPPALVRGGRSCTRPVRLVLTAKREKISFKFGTCEFTFLTTDIRKNNPKIPIELKWDLPPMGWYKLKVVYYDCGLYIINYEDGDSEDLDSSEIRGMLLDDSYLDDDLTQRRIALDDLVLKNSVNVRDGFGKSSDDPNKDGCGVEPSVSSGGGLSSENGEEQVEGDADSTS